MLIKNKQQGFSMIELLVAIVIVGVLTSLALPSYRAWIQNQQIRAAAESILNGIQVARSEAIKNNGKARFVLCALPASSWEVLAASAAAPAPTASLACGAGSPAPAQPGEVRVQERSGQEGSRLTQVAATSVPPAAPPLASDGTYSVTFNSFGRVVANSFGLVTSISTIAVTTPTGDRPLWIAVGAGGNIRMCDPSPLLVAKDPRRCL